MPNWTHEVPQETGQYWFFGKYGWDFEGSSVKPLEENQMYQVVIMREHPNYPLRYNCNNGWGSYNPSIFNGIFTPRKGRRPPTEPSDVRD